MDASETQVHRHAQICLKPQLSVFKCKEGRGVDQQKMKYAENISIGSAAFTGHGSPFVAYIYLLSGFCIKRLR